MIELHYQNKAITFDVDGKQSDFRCQVTFTGMVQPTNDNLIAIEYVPLLSKEELHSALSSHLTDDTHLLVVHRVGIVPVHECCSHIVLFCQKSHDHAFTLLQSIIEHLKRYFEKIPHYHHHS